jgi:hypothetical protein
MIYIVSIWLLPVLIAVTFHEAAHGFVARFLGDETASRLGRVSLNPLRHIDPFGTILLPGLLLLARSPFLFGYAKRVPVNFRRLRQSEPRGNNGDEGNYRQPHAMEKRAGQVGPTFGELTLPTTACSEPPGDVAARGGMAATGQ